MNWEGQNVRDVNSNFMLCGRDYRQTKLILISYAKVWEGLRALGFLRICVLMRYISTNLIILFLLFHSSPISGGTASLTAPLRKRLPWLPSTTVMWPWLCVSGGRSGTTAVPPVAPKRDKKSKSHKSRRETKDVSHDGWTSDGCCFHTTFRRPKSSGCTFFFTERESATGNLSAQWHANCRPVLSSWSL